MTEVKKGNFVEIKRIQLEGIIVRDVWVPARIVGLGQETFMAQAVRGGFDGKGHDCVVLSLHERGRAWR